MNEYEINEYAESEPTISIPLRIGMQALSVLKVAKERMWAPDAPPVALVELFDGVYTLGGQRVEDYLDGLGCPLLQQERLQTGEGAPSEIHDSVTLLLGERSLRALWVPQHVMDGPNPPRLGLVAFGPVYRLGGDMIADYIEEFGARAVRGSHLDYLGDDVRCENTWN